MVKERLKHKIFYFCLNFTNPPKLCFQFETINLKSHLNPLNYKTSSTNSPKSKKNINLKQCSEKTTHVWHGRSCLGSHSILRCWAITWLLHCRQDYVVIFCKWFSVLSENKKKTKMWFYSRRHKNCFSLLSNRCQ